MSLFVFVAALLLSVLSFETARAKDLTNRLGVGYSDQFSVALPSLSARYYPNPQLGVTAALGVDTQKDASRFGLMVRLFKMIFLEDNMNFYMGTGAGLISIEQNAGTNQSGFELTGFVGSEFFFPGLESLGFSFEAGIGVTSISSEVRFRTIGDSPLKAGVIFYF